MSDSKELIPTPEIDQFGELNEKLSNEEIREKLKNIEIISRIMEVGQQTSYQNKFFVLNPIEFPTGTSGKSRQAIFEAAVRIDVLKGHLFEHKKINGEMKKIQAQLIRANKKRMSDDEADRLEAEGDIIIAEAELRQKELSLSSIEAKANNVLRQINDFYEEFEKNEQSCNTRGFSYKDWNSLEVENDYWNQVTDRKVKKAAAYTALGMSQQLGDSLPLQNNLNIDRIEHVKKSTIDEINKNIEEKKGKVIEDKREQIKDVWVVTFKDKVCASDQCPHKKNEICEYRSPIIGKCSYTYCYSLGLINE